MTGLFKRFVVVMFAMEGFLGRKNIQPAIITATPMSAAFTWGEKDLTHCVNLARRVSLGFIISMDIRNLPFRDLLNIGTLPSNGQALIAITKRRVAPVLWLF